MTTRSASIVKKPGTAATAPAAARAGSKAVPAKNSPGKASAGAAKVAAHGAAKPAPAKPAFKVPETMRWVGGPAGTLRIIDQTRLPEDVVHVDLSSVEEVREAIKTLRVRGAPAIGVAAAYGVYIGVRDKPEGPAAGKSFQARVDEVAARLAESRPTAVNLFWALDRMKKAAAALLAAGKIRPDGTGAVALLREAETIHAEDAGMCAAIGRHGSALIRDGMYVLTHCNAGALATAGEGTALSVLYAAARLGRKVHVWADETRPLLQGARLTAWELSRAGIDVTVICDSMAASLMKAGRVDCVIVGADRIAVDGDTANKIGTYGLAVLARAHGVPFYVAAPSSTFDMSIGDGLDIPIEQRHADEVAAGFGRRTVPHGVAVYNPAFDVTPAEYISAIITERGVIRPVTAATVRRVLSPVR